MLTTSTTCLLERSLDDILQVFHLPLHRPIVKQCLRSIIGLSGCCVPVNCCEVDVLAGLAAAATGSSSVLL